MHFDLLITLSLRIIIVMPSSQIEVTVKDLCAPNFYRLLLKIVYLTVNILTYYWKTSTIVELVFV